jgi:hypothetical protein
MMTLLRRAALLAASLATAAAHAAFQGTFLDRNFGVDGTAILPAPPGMSTHVGALASTRDGGLLLVSHLVPAQGPSRTRLNKLRPDGSLDTSFGEQGTVDLSRHLLPAFGDFAVYSLLEDSRGRLVVGFGVVEYPEQFARCMDGRLSFGLLRLQANGGVDAWFGGRGVARWATAPAPACEHLPRITGIVERPGGELVFYGSRSWIDIDAGDTSRLFVVQVTGDGTLDPRFGAGGFTEASLGSSNHNVRTARLLPDGVLEGLVFESPPGGKSAYRRWHAAPGGVLSFSAAPESLGTPHLQADGTYVFYVPVAIDAFALEYRDPAGRLQARVDMKMDGFHPTTLLRTPDGGTVLRGNERRVVNGSLGWEPGVLCVWRSGGRLQGCVDPFVGEPAGSPYDATHLAPDGRLYIVERTVNASTGEVTSWVGRFEVTAPVVEYHNDILGHYFSAYDGAEAQIIDAGGAGPGWRRTGTSFKSGGARPVCRFYGTPGIGPNSHFHTIEPAECEAVKRDPGWTYEGLGFYATPVVAGACAAPLRPVHRFYNGRWRENDSNHRYVTDAALAGEMTARGWIHEGVVFCALPS